jgi:hypothetical protein
MRFNDAEAVQFFQKPFLEAFDPELRKGVRSMLRLDRNFNRRSRPATPFRPAQPLWVSRTGPAFWVCFFALVRRASRHSKTSDKWSKPDSAAPDKAY